MAFVHGKTTNQVKTPPGSLGGETPCTARRAPAPTPAWSRPLRQLVDMRLVRVVQSVIRPFDNVEATARGSEAHGRVRAARGDDRHPLVVGTEHQVAGITGWATRVHEGGAGR